MDRSFLSQRTVVDASRNFVCIRLTTYENKQEAEFLKAFEAGQSAELENTVVVLLGPDGKTQLSRPSRGLRFVFGDPETMASRMNRIASRYPVRAEAKQSLPGLPQADNVRLALNVAACDNQPLVILYAKDAEQLSRLREHVRTLAWSNAFLGQFVYVTTTDAKELTLLDKSPTTPGIYVVQADRYGQKGTLLASAKASASPKELSQALQSAGTVHEVLSKTFQSHVRAGQREGIFWETPLPVTDPMEKRARERGRRQ